MKLKSLFLATILLSATLSNSAMAGCLDRIPTTKEELKVEIRKAKIEHSISVENRAMYDELASSARLRKNLATASLHLGLVPWTIGSGAFAFASYAMGEMGGAILLSSVFVTEGTLLTMSIYDLGQGIISGEFKLPTESSVEPGYCSYNELNATLDARRAEVIEVDFDGSLTHQLKDTFTLGRHSSKSTLKLLEIAQLKTILAQAKLAELNSLKL